MSHSTQSRTQPQPRRPHLHPWLCHANEDSAEKGMMRHTPGKRVKYPQCLSLRLCVFALVTTTTVPGKQDHTSARATVAGEERLTVSFSG
jgi:hypothetical protein